MQRIHYTALILTSLVIMIVFAVYYVLKDFQKRAIESQTDPFAYVPQEVNLLLHTRSPVLFLESVTNTAPLTADLARLWNEGNPLNLLQQIDSLTQKDPAIRTAWKESNMVLAFEVIPENQTSFFVQLTTPGGTSRNTLEEFVFQTVLEGKEVRQQPHGQTTLYTLTGEHPKEELYISFKQSALLLSNHLPYLTDVSNITEAGHPLDLLRQSAGRFSDNLYLHTSVFCHFLPEKPILPLISECSHPGSWHVWDISYSMSELMLNGFVEAEGSSLFSLFRHQKPMSSKMEEHIPVSAGTIFYTGLWDVDSFAPLYHSWLEASPDLLQSIKGYRASFNDIAGVYQDSILDQWTGEVAWIHPQKSGIDQGVVLAGIKNPGFFRDHPEIGIFLSDITGDLAITGDWTIHRLNIPGFIPSLTRGLINQNFNFIAFSDVFLLAADQLQPLQAYLEELAFGNTFYKGSARQKMEDVFHDRHNLFLYHTMDNGIDKPESANLLNSFGYFIWQVLPSPGQLLFSHAMLQQQPAFAGSNPPRWETTLKAPVHAGPFGVFNHTDHSREIIVQDQENQLYLLNREGEILWSKEISGPAMSEIFQVDIYKNNRYQYLFNTRNYLHLIDRNGNYVTGFPMRLPAPASAGIAVFDYDRNKNYRIIFPAENLRVYNYSLNRTPVSGWQYGTSETQVNTPIQHIRLSGKDFLFLTDTAGNLEILNRRGLSRVQMRQNIKAGARTQIYAHASDEEKPHFVAAGEKGVLHKINLDGTVYSFFADTMPEIFVFQYEHFSNEGYKDLIFFHEGTLSVYNTWGRLQFSFSLPGARATDIQVFNISGQNKYIGITDIAQNRLFLVSREGELHYQFPLQGDTPFYLEKLQKDKKALVTGLHNKILYYEILF